MILLYFWLGLSVAFESFKKIHHEWKSMLLVSILQLFIVPLIGIWFSYELPSGMSRGIMVMLALAPGGVTSAIAARFMKLDIAVNVAFSSLTALLYLFIIQPIFVPLLVNGMKTTSESILPMIFSLIALTCGMALNYFRPIVAQWFDKILAIGIFLFVIFHIVNEIKSDNGINWTLVVLMIKFHFIVVLISAILASVFFNLDRAPLIVLESGFQNVSLIAALGIPLGWSPMMPMIYGVIMFLSAAIMWLNLIIIRKSKLRKITIKSKRMTWRNYIIIPPFGVLIKDVPKSFSAIKSAAYQWQQFKKLGLLGFYFRVVWGWIQQIYNKAIPDRNKS